MARKVNCIKEIDDSKETWKLAVRITNIWSIQRSPRQTIEIIFMDKEGDKIVAQVKNMDTEKWKGQLKEGSSYIVQNFEVETNGGQYKASNHRYKLIFAKGTIVKEQELPDIPKNIYHFTQFEAINNGIACVDVLIDVIGEFVDIVQWQLDGKPKKVVFTMKNQRGSTITCTLWELFALQLKSFLEKHETGPVVLLIQLAKIKDAKGKYPVSIQNSMYGSKLFINEKIVEIEEFMNSLESSQISGVSYSQRISQLSSCSQLTSEEQFLHNAQVKSLTNLSEIEKDCYCVTVATIKKLLVANGWSYEGCPKCNRKIEATTSPYTCAGCHSESSTTVTRFRLEVRVSHQEQTSTFILWDRECNQLIKQAASEIKKELIAEEGEFDPKSIPEAIDNVLNKMLAFKVKVTPKSSRFSVAQVCEDEQIIKSILSQIPTDKESLKTNKEKSVSFVQKLDEVVESQSMSATADYDPDFLQSLTPAKRLSSDSQFDDVACEDLASVQLSSSKLSKHIKTESV